jgi:maltose alpha-D-glucosyltransferase/alpha-amylase
MAKQPGSAPDRLWKRVLDGDGAESLETVGFPAFLPKQRWFGEKSHHIRSTRILDWAALNTSNSALALVEVKLEDELVDLFLISLGMTFGDSRKGLQRSAPNAIVSPIVSGAVAGILNDAIYDDKACGALLSLIANSGELRAHTGRIRGVRGEAFQDLLGAAQLLLPVKRGSAEQSNTSILYGDRFILKLFRRLEPGPNPDCEICRFLSEKTTFHRVPPFAGLIEYQPDGDAPSVTLAMLQGLVANERDAWKWTLEELDHYFQACAPLVFPKRLRGELGNPMDLSEHPASQLARHHVGNYLDAAAMLGRRTAELHLALSVPTDDAAFSAVPLTMEDIHEILDDLRGSASAAFGALRKQLSQLPDDTFEMALSVLSRRRWILENFDTLKTRTPRAKKIRIHGDYHLGQVLVVKTDFVILDFEGEPARPLPYRRSKQCPLKDVAGMLRSFSYAAYTSLFNYTARHPEGAERLAPWAQLWERAAAAEFLRAYRETTRGADFLPSDGVDFRRLLDIFLMDKAFYEVVYELNSRPAWLRIPLMGIMTLLERVVLRHRSVGRALGACGNGSFE